MTKMLSRLRRMTRIAAIVSFAAVVLSASAASAQSLPPLGSAQSFAVLGGSTVTSTGGTIVIGDLGVNPGTAITGFLPPPANVIVGPGTVTDGPGLVNGTIHASDAVALDAQSDLTAAYNNLAGQASTSLKSGQDLGGQTLVAGVYTFDSSGPSAQLTGDLTLDAQGNASAVFIFQTVSTLTTAAASSVRLINGAQACNVFWQVGSSATLGAGTTFRGSILAYASVTLGNLASVSGSVLARNGFVTLAANIVSACPPAVADDEPPAITVTSPIEPIYELGSLLLAEYSCADAVTCAGDVASGSALDTGTPGLKSFTITATDAAGNTTTQLVTYTVSLGRCVAPYAGLTAWLPGEGSAVETVTGAAAIWNGSEAYVPGKAAQAFSVGTGRYLSLPFQQVGAFTLQAWVRAPDRLLPEDTGVLSTGAPAQNATSLQIELDGNGNYRLNVGDRTLSWLLGPALDFFQQVAVTFDGSTLTTYLNGQLVQSDVWTGSPGLGFHVLNVGIDREGLHPFTGLVDEVQVFNRALSDEEVMQTFLTGASGLCNNRPPVAVAVAAPNPAEATGPDGAIVSLDGAGSSDPDLDPLACTWHEGATRLGTACLLSTGLTIGSHAITLTVDDGQGRTAASDLVVDVRDMTGPALSVPVVVLAEATSPLGASVLYTASATDVVSGAVPMACAPASGSGFAIGSTVVNCSATDTTGNIASTEFNVVVRDTIAPEVQIMSSADALSSGSTLAVVVRTNDTVGIAAVTVNGVEATRTVGTTQAGTWLAAVPVTLPVAPGGVLRFEVRASDTAGNAGTATLLVDNDGIPAAMDRSRVGGIDESGSYSNDFAHGPTAGTLTRNGWTMKVSSAPTPGGLRATVSGSGSIARISACTGAAKEVRLDVIGETADITCASTGTITVKAISAVLQIELREQLAMGAWQQFNLRTGQSMSVGSPATASIENVGPIAVHLVQIDGAGPDTVVGSYQLRPGASVDVSALPRAPGRQGQVRFKVLRGIVSVTVSGRTRTLTAGQRATMLIERMSPILP